MTIRKSDGSVYQPLGSMSSFDPSSQSNKLLCRYHSEIIDLFGVPIFYYKVQMGTTKIDKLYVECRSKVYSQTPIQLHATYEPATSGILMGDFGLDGAINSTIFNLNLNVFNELVQREPRPGDLIYTPFRREWHECMNRSITGFYKYTQYQLQIFAVKLQENLTDMFNQTLYPASPSDMPNAPIC